MGRQLTLRAGLALCLLGAAALALSCGGGGQTWRRTGTQTSNVTTNAYFDVRVCFPLLDASTIERTTQADWRRYAEDVAPRVRECSAALFRREGQHKGTVKLVFEVGAAGATTVAHTSTLDDPEFLACVDRAVAPVPWPPAAMPERSRFTWTQEVRHTGPRSLRIGASPAGTITGRMRLHAAERCRCLGAYKDRQVPRVGVKYSMLPGSPLPQEITLTSDGGDPTLAACLVEDLAALPIEAFEKKYDIGHTFRFDNSRLPDPADGSTP